MLPDSATKVVVAIKDAVEKMDPRGSINILSLVTATDDVKTVDPRVSVEIIVLAANDGLGRIASGVSVTRLESLYWSPTEKRNSAAPDPASPDPAQNKQIQCFKFHCSS